MTKIVIILSLLFTSSCGENKLNKVETLSSFRVLAIQSTTPELTQTTRTITARPYVSDTNSSGRVITAVVDGCVDPGISFGAEVTCLDNPTKVTSSYSVDTGKPGFLLHSGWGDNSSALAIPDSIFLGRTAREKYNGVAYIILFSFSVDGIIYKSFKRIFITERTILNSNPALSSLLINGGPIAKPQNGDYLSAVTSGAETYDYLLVDGITESRSEKLTMAWYVSSGTLDTPKANASESIRYKSDPPATQLLIIGVLRDERGGVAVLDSLL